MAMNKDELLEAIGNLSHEQLKLVSEYVEKVNKKTVLNEEAMDFILENYDETFKDLVNR